MAREAAFWCSSHSVRHFQISPSSGSGIREFVRSASQLLIRDVLKPQLEICFDITQTLIDHPLSWLFRHPVDEERDGAPDYYQTVKTPMDLGTVLSRLQSGAYSSAERWQRDIDLIWENCELYNGRDSEFQPLINEMRRVVRRGCRALPPRGLKAIALDLGTTIRGLNARMDAPPPEAAEMFPTDHYTDTDLRLPFSDRDLIALVNDAQALPAKDTYEFGQVAREFGLHRVKAGEGESVDVEGIPDEAKVYIRAFIRERAPTRR
jgi:hypothetical protein